MSKSKILFIDRDGTLIHEPEDQQIDNLAKFKLENNVIPVLIALIKAGYRLVMVSNQDGLDTKSFPISDFIKPQQMLLDIFQTQGIRFETVLICPHKPEENCECRKPKVGLMMDYLRDLTWDREHSYVIGDRITDVKLAENLGISAIHYSAENNWLAIADTLLNADRKALVNRITKETNIEVKVNLDQSEPIQIQTGIGFFDHMLEQLAKHSGISMMISVKGDLHIDEHHTVEDTALALGEALKQALGDKRGIQRYGFLLPMDEALVQIALDLSGRTYFKFDGVFTREKVGELSTELVPHFFRSLAEALQANLHIKVEGENNHHMVEAIFKGVARTLRQAIQKQGDELPTTKGVL